jgi:hypothetical protein
MHVLEVRNAELIASITYAAIGGTYIRPTSAPRSPAPYVIPSNHHVAVPPHEQIVFEQFPDEDAPQGRGRINDTRVKLQ